MQCLKNKVVSLEQSIGGILMNELDDMRNSISLTSKMTDKEVKPLFNDIPSNPFSFSNSKEKSDSKPTFHFGTGVSRHFYSCSADQY